MISTLPPLPSFPGENDDYQYMPSGRSIIAVLSDEHAQLRALSNELAGGAADHLRELADVITAAVTRHLSAEEQYLYPTVKALVPEGDVLTERELEHDTRILQRLAWMESVAPDSKAFRDLAESLDAELFRHEEICTSVIFPRLSEIANKADLIRLGNRVEIAEEAAPTRPHPASPARPPWNKVTDPAIGVIDKIRDVMSGRKTYRKDLATDSRPS